MTIEELAEKAGVSARAIGDIERGARAPRIRTLSALARGLDLSDASSADLFNLSVARPRTAERATGPGPRRLRDFTGRESEVAQVVGALSDPLAVVVISGSAGFGKTTLAVESAARFRGETYVFVDLGGLGRPALSALQVLQRVLRQLDPRAEPSASLEATAARWATVSAEKQLVIVLDNVSEEDQVRPLLAAPRRGPVILTSRRSLGGISANVRLRLESLSSESSLDLLERLIPEAQRGDGELAQLSELCQGVPLALRVAGNRVAARPATSVADFVARLQSEERRLSLLVAGDMSVEAALNTSYAELDPQSAALFRSLSLIEGSSFTADVAAIACGLTEWHSEDLLEGLVDVGMVEARENNRYRLHDLVRVFAGSRLRTEDDADDVLVAKRRLSYSFIRTLLSLGRPPRLVPPHLWPGREFVYPGYGSDKGARSWAPLEQDCWWAAVRWVAEIGDNEAVLLVATALEGRIAAWAELPQILEVQRMAVTAAQRLGDRRAESLRLSAATWGVLTVEGNPPAAFALADQALEAALDSGDAYAVAKARFMAGACSIITMRELADAENHLVAAMEGFDAVGASAEAVEVRSFLGAFYRRTGRVDESIRELRAAVDVVGQEFHDDEPVSFSIARGTALAELTAAYISTGDADEAIRCAESLVAGWSPESDFYEGRARAIRATALAALGHFDAAREELDEVTVLLAQYRDSGQAQIAQEHIALATELIARGRAS